MNQLKEEIQKLKTQYELVEERLNLSLSAGKLAWWEMEMPGGRVVFNENKVLMLGYDPRDFINAHYSDFTKLIHPDDYDNAMRAMEYHLMGKADLYQVTYRIQAKDGSYRWFYDRGSITERDESGRPLKIKGIVFDDTERIESALALEQSEKELKYVNATKDKFFSILAHDLRNPFSVIMGMADILKSDLDAFSRQDLIDMLGRIKDSSENAWHLMEDLLTWSQSQSGKIGFSPEPLKLLQLIEQAISPYEEFARKKNITYSLDVAKDFMLHADEFMLKTILRNLFSNAVKFTPNEGRIVISAENKGIHARISVKDTGVGMDAKTKENLFRIDRQQKSQGTEGESGTGLGLVLCKEFVERHNGKIEVKSEAGKGSTFILRLPA